MFVAEGVTKRGEDEGEEEEGDAKVEEAEEDND